MDLVCANMERLIFIFFSVQAPAVVVLLVCRPSRQSIRKEGCLELFRDSTR